MREDAVFAKISRFPRSTKKERRFAIRKSILRVRRRAAPFLPLPARLPGGERWLAWNDVVGRKLFLKRYFETCEQGLVSNYLKPGMTVLDIGAHQGFYTLLASSKVGSRGSVVAFEPSPREMRRLHINLILNRCHNVSTVKKALNDTAADADFYVCRGVETGCNSLYPPVVAERTEKIRIKTTTLDAYLNDASLDRVDFIKIDVEGAELSVLRGAVETLDRYRPALLCEIADKRTEAWGHRAWDIIEYLETRGYRCYFFSPGGDLHRSHEKDTFNENLVAFHRDRRDDILPYMNGKVDSLGSTYENDRFHTHASSRYYRDTC
jgi:FkbM family methyltransferase